VQTCRLFYCWRHDLRDLACARLKIVVSSYLMIAVRRIGQPTYQRLQIATQNMKNPNFGKLIRKVNLYPPFLGMGIRVRSSNDDFTRFEVELRARWYNRNLFGTHFGGSLYSMTDPFYVFIITMNLGDGYIVWDKSAGIEFLKPAKGTILGVFEVSKTRLAEIRAEVDELGKNTYHFDAELTDEQGLVVARVAKEIYVRSKAARRDTPKPGNRMA
jgi:acyl-coenzyme A thioesterase PaaI-like protein